MRRLDGGDLMAFMKAVKLGAGNAGDKLASAQARADAEGLRADQAEAKTDKQLQFIRILAREAGVDISEAEIEVGNAAALIQKLKIAKQDRRRAVQLIESPPDECKSSERRENEKMSRPDDLTAMIEKAKLEVAKAKSAAAVARRGGLIDEAQAFDTKAAEGQRRIDQLESQLARELGRTPLQPAKKAAEPLAESAFEVAKALATELIGAGKLKRGFVNDPKEGLKRIFYLTVPQAERADYFERLAPARDWIIERVHSQRTFPQPPHKRSRPTRGMER